MAFLYCQPRKMSKGELRRQIISLRNQFSAGERILKSNTIQEKLFGMDEYRNANTVLFYVSTGSEVHTHGMIRAALGEKRVAVPVSRPDFSMEPALISSMGELQPGAMGILEPRNPTFLPVGEIDLVLVPSVAFDASGNRIGYGKGYYDRFLPRVSRETPVIGLAFEQQVVEKVPADAHDMPVSMVLSEKKLYRGL